MIISRQNDCVFEKTADILAGDHCPVILSKLVPSVAVEV